MTTADPKLEALLELERRGKLPAEGVKMLAGYRAQGTTKTKPLGPNGQPISNSGQTLETSKARDDARKSLLLIDRVQPQLDRVKGLYDRQLKGAGPMQSLREYLPSQGHSQFDNAAASLRMLVRPLSRTQGEGAMTDFESRLALQPLPDRWSFDGANEEALVGLQRLLDTSRTTYAKQLGLPTPPPKPRPRPRNIRIDTDGNILP